MTEKKQWDRHTDRVPRRNPQWAASDRGWFFVDGLCRGNYLDYGPEHYRSPHDYCRDGECTCRRSQPGNVHAVRYPDGPSTPCEARYFTNVGAASDWIERPFLGFDPGPSLGLRRIHGTAEDDDYFVVVVFRRSRSRDDKERGVGRVHHPTSYAGLLSWELEDSRECGHLDGEDTVVGIGETPVDALCDIPRNVSSIISCSFEEEAAAGDEDWS